MFFSSGGSRCKYNWRLSAECDPVTNMKQIPLKKGGADCEKFRSVDCDKMGPGGRGGRGNRGQGRGRKNKV